MRGPNVHGIFLSELLIQVIWNAVYPGAHTLGALLLIRNGLALDLVLLAFYACKD